MSRPKLKDVAQLAGVSEPTVSRVLNGKPGVAEATRTKVIETLHSLGWDDIKEPNSERSGVVGLVTGEFSNPVFATFVDTISAALARSGYLTTIAVTAPPVNTEDRCVDQLVRSGVDAIVFLGGHHAAIGEPLDGYMELVDAGTPVVLVNGRRTELPVPHVLADEQVAAHRATRHLLSLGHERIGCLLGWRNAVPTERMIAGHAAALAESGHQASPDDIVEATFTSEAGMAGARRLIEAGYTAAICGNDLIALGAISAAVSMGRDVPHEFSVVGYDGTTFTELTGPPLTTMRQPFDKMARLIVDAINGELSGSDRYQDHFVFEPELIARSSSGRPVSVAGASTP